MPRLSNIIILIAAGVSFHSCTDPLPNTRSLPYYGPHDILKEMKDGVLTTDTVYYTVPKFSFVNQDSLIVSHQDYDGHVYVADFFFSNCKTICPVMTSQLARLQSKLEQDSLFGDVKLLSHTVDADRDEPEILKRYAEGVGADLSHWNFVTGDKNELYDQAQKGYLVTAFESDTAAGGFFHTDQFVLLDRERHIRGYYDGTSTVEVDSLFNDIRLLLEINKNGQRK